MGMPVDRATISSAARAGAASGKPASRKRKPRTAAQQRAKRQMRAVVRAAAREVPASTQDQSVSSREALNVSPSKGAAGAGTKDAMRAAGGVTARPSATPEAVTGDAAMGSVDPTAGAKVDAAVGVRVDTATGARDRRATRSIRLLEVLRLASMDSATDCGVSVTSQVASVTDCVACATDQSGSAVDCSTSVTDHTATVTDELTSVTDHTAAATDELTSVTSQIQEPVYYEIFGKNYGVGRVTVDANYATTKQAWHVARIVDRRLTVRGAEYRVLWLNASRFNRHFYQRTWEPRSELLKDGFDKELELVDCWKEVSLNSTFTTAKDATKSFDQFCMNDEFGAKTIDADTSGLCLFMAFKRAANLTGHPDIVTQRDIDCFVTDELAFHGIDLERGTTWKVFLVILRRLRDAGRDFIYKAIDRDHFAIAGRRGARVLSEIDLFDGIYLVAAYNHSFVGHAIVLTVQGTTRVVYDNDDGKPVASADWINFVALIRPFIVFKGK